MCYGNSPQCNSAVIEIEVSPIACMSSSSMVDDSGSASKRELEQPVDGVLKREK
ncbi:transposase [Sesbania bispinosa]|nr:transposase [Sesbania bispinosa]